MNRSDFKIKITNHDWYYMYSDDYRVYSKGYFESDQIIKFHRELNCPFNLKELSNFVHNMIFEDFEERKHGMFYRKNSKYKTAPASIDDLISQSKAIEINDWFNDENSICK